MYRDKIVIPLKLQKYVVKWYHTYLLHPGLDKTEVIIYQHLYLPGISEHFKKEVTGCDTCQRTKWSTKTNGELPVKLAEGTPRNKICVDITAPYKIRGKGK